MPWFFCRDFAAALFLLQFFYRTFSVALPDHPMEPCENIDSNIVPKTKKRPAWLEATLQDTERLKVPKGTFRKSRRPKRFSSYATYMTKLLDEEPTTIEEAVQKGQWKEAMMEEHQSIMQNEVWEIVARRNRG